MRNIGGRVRALRTEKQITLPGLATRTGLSKGLLSKLENDDDSNPSLATLYKIAEGLEVTLADILETEQAQIKRIVPQDQPDWQKGLISYLKSIHKVPDQDILNAMYVLRNRKSAKVADLEQWKFLYLSIENSFKK
ncbi:MAG: helix-turn-helix transcriptional regulator [Verrucomicrobiota bacterium]